MLAPPMQHGNYPFFTFSQSRSTDCSQLAQRIDDELRTSTLAGRSSGQAPSLATFHTEEKQDGDTDVVVEPALPPPDDVLVGDFVIVDKPAEDIELV